MLPAQTVDDVTERLCLLRRALGTNERCSDRCAFWEVGGAVLSAGCAVERIGLQFEVEQNPRLASGLLSVRAQLEAADDPGLFDQLLPPDLQE